MRVPWPIVILLSLAVVAGAWIAGTRKVDFLQEPSAERLAAVSREAAAGVVRAEMPLPASTTLSYEVDKRPPQRIQTRRAEKLTEEDRNPPLDTFTNLGKRGARHLIDLSRFAEKAGDRPRALLGWERVIDSCRQVTIHTATARATVKRLREVAPPWSASNRPLPVVIQLSGPESRQEKLAEVLGKLEHDLLQASHGVLAPSGNLILIKPEPPKPVPTSKSKSKSKSRVKRTVRPPPPPPVTLTLTGPGENARATSKVTLTVSSSASATAHYDEALRQLLKLVTATLNKNKDRRTIDTPEKKESIIDALSFRITRLRWFELAKDLNTPPETTPPKDPSPP